MWQRMVWPGAASTIGGAVVSAEFARDDGHRGENGVEMSLEAGKIVVVAGVGGALTRAYGVGVHGGHECNRRVAMRQDAQHIGNWPRRMDRI